MLDSTLRAGPTELQFAPANICVTLYLNTFQHCLEDFLLSVFAIIFLSFTKQLFGLFSIFVCSFVLNTWFPGLSNSNEFPVRFVFKHAATKRFNFF